MKNIVLAAAVLLLPAGALANGNAKTAVGMAAECIVASEYSYDAMNKPEHLNGERAADVKATMEQARKTAEIWKGILSAMPNPQAEKDNTLQEVKAESEKGAEQAPQMMLMVVANIFTECAKLSNQASFRKNHIGG